MVQNKRNQQRKSSIRPHREKRKAFVIAYEGHNSEPQYFAELVKLKENLVIKPVPRKKTRSSANQVLNSMIAYLIANPLSEKDEAWIVIDRDDWPDDQINSVTNWANGVDEYHLALSNPNFECWLLYHFQDVRESTNIDKALKTHLPNYTKRNIGVNKFNQENIVDAIHRAKKRDKPPCTDWPREHGKTTVYRLVENILTNRQAIPTT